MNNPLADLDQVFRLQLCRILSLLYPKPHSPGPCKPSLEEQEQALLNPDPDGVEDE